LNKIKLYWTCQVIGWGGYVFLIGLLNKLSGNELDGALILNTFSTFAIGLLSSHFYRNLILRYHWLRLNIPRLIPRVLLMSVLMATLFYFLHSFVSEIVIAHRTVSYKFLDVFQNVLNLTANYVLWSLLYWLFHFIENYKKEEIKNLKWQAAKNEIELNKLKSQLNPHFIFNSMNSIRALVENHPSKAKDSITQLSNILRNSLFMGKKKYIDFFEEMALVNDYLALEKTRFEERLQVTVDIDDKASSFKVPPLMIQTLVENAIKHGISKIPSGGEVNILGAVQANQLRITILNTGKYENPNELNNKGFGLKNTIQRLHLLYGDHASFRIGNSNDGVVVAELRIPKLGEQKVGNSYQKFKTKP
jgi:two-component system LytT family sensor kinase